MDVELPAHLDAVFDSADSAAFVAAPAGAAVVVAGEVGPVALDVVGKQPAFQVPSFASRPHVAPGQMAGRRGWPDTSHTVGYTFAGDG